MECPKCGAEGGRNGRKRGKVDWICRPPGCGHRWIEGATYGRNSYPVPDDALEAMRAAGGREKEGESPMVKALRKDGMKKPLAFAKQLGLLEKQFEQRVAVYESGLPKKKGAGPEPGELPIEDESSEKLLLLCGELLRDYNQRRLAGAK